MVIPVQVEDKEEKYYTLLDPYPVLQSYSSRTVKSLSELREVKVSRVLKGMIDPVSQKIQLFHWDTQRKILASRTIAESGDLKFIKLLEERLKVETNEEVKAAFSESIAKLKIGSPDKNERIKAIEWLSKSKSPETAGYLSSKLAVEKDTDVATKLKDTIEDIEAATTRTEIVQNLFTGLSLGSILILMALGLAIIYGLMGIINMAHGEFMMIGAYTTFIIQTLFSDYLPPALTDYYFWVALPFAFIISGVIGMMIEFLIIRFLYNRPLESLLATWGVSLILIQTARSIFGDLTAVKMPSFATGGMEIMSQLVLPYSRIFIIGVTILVVLVVRYILLKTTFGLKIRAVTQNRNMSSCLGIPTTKVNRYAFFLGTGIAGVAGWALTLISNVVPNMGQTYIVDSFLVVVTGGVGKLAGTILSGLGMGFTTKILEPVFQAVYGKVIILILVILFLQIKPTGLFPAKGRSEE